MAAQQSHLCPEQDRDLYAALGVTPSASAALIRSSFKQQALLCHPDKVAEGERQDATQRCQLLLEAYRVLSDEASRQRYDDARAVRTQVSNDESRRRFDNDQAARAQTTQAAWPKVDKPQIHFIKKHCFGCDGFCLPADMRKCPKCPSVCAGLICPSCETCAACDCGSPAKRRRAVGVERSPLWAEELGEAWHRVDRFADSTQRVTQAEQRHDQDRARAKSQKAELLAATRKHRSLKDEDWFGSLVGDSSSSWTGKSGNTSQSPPDWIADLRSAMSWSMLPDFWKK